MLFPRATRLFLATGILVAGLAQPAWPAETVTVRSRSGQFVVRGSPLGAALFQSAGTNRLDYIRLDPTLLAISCERIKHALLEDLRMEDHWRGAVIIALHPVRVDDEPVVVTSIRFTDRWSYRLQIPELVNRERLLKAVVQVLLLELANRRAGVQSAELPLWLSEGFPRHLAATALGNLTFEPETRISRSLHGGDPFKAVREELRQHAPLTLDQLSWPEKDGLAGEKGKLYRACAQAFTTELLRLKDGRDCLREMILHLPAYLNWQTGFLRAFGGHFNRLVDVDKWWLVNAVYLSGRDPRAVWPRETGWEQLAAMLQATVEVRLTRNDLPLAANVRLQQIIREWDFQRQRPVLVETAQRLAALRLRLAPQQAVLAGEYRQVLEDYVEQYDPSGSKNPPRVSARTKLLVSETLKRLDELDQQRQRLQTEPSLNSTVNQARR